MKILKGNAVTRDQSASVFAGILERLCETSGALAAALVDSEGETVDYSGRADPFELRVAAAEWRLVLSLVQDVADTSGRRWARAKEILVRSSGQSFALWALSEGYALVLVLPRHAFRVSRRALEQTAAELESEAGLVVPRGGPRDRARWSSAQVDVEPSEPTRPRAVRVGEAWRPVTILGRLERHELQSLEKGYLVRLPNGRELLLVREPLGKWFAGDPI